jgi:hypothetical protein
MKRTAYFKMAATERVRLRISVICDNQLMNVRKLKKQPLLILRFVEYKRHEGMNVLL